MDWGLEQRSQLPLSLEGGRERMDVLGVLKRKKARGFLCKPVQSTNILKGPREQSLKSKLSLTSCLCLLGLLRPGHLSPLYFNWSLKKKKKKKNSMTWVLL